MKTLEQRMKTMEECINFTKNNNGNTMKIMDKLMKITEKYEHPEKITSTMEKRNNRRTGGKR